ncbi:Transposase, partial [Caligus rogercresseyi]
TPDSYFLIRIKLARTVNEIHGDLPSTFPDSCPGLSTLQRWHTEFDKDVFALEKKTSPGQENVARVKRLVEDYPPDDHSTSCCRGVPTIYNCFEASDGGSRAPKPPQRAPNKTQRVKCCQDLLKLFQDHGEDFLGSHLLVQDESWFYWDSADPRGPVFIPPCETDSEEDDVSDGVHLQAEAADRNTMIEYLRTTGKRFLTLKKDKIRLKDCLLIWDNALPDRRDVEPVKQSPYSPHLSHEEATLAVQRAMRRVSEDELYYQLRKLRGHCHDVIA